MSACKIKKSTVDDLIHYFQGCSPFQNLGLASLPKNYVWPKKGDFPDLSPIIGKSFEISGDTFQKNVFLKLNSKDLWEKYGGIELAKWVVSEWGGIRGNKNSTLQSYVDRVNTGSDFGELRGVASYSKILSFKDPTQYAIYDARVAISINAIQLILGRNQGLAFRYLTGRNKTLQRFRDDVRTSYVTLTNNGWAGMQPDDTYHTYLTLLKEVAEHLNSVAIYELEMCLFADAESLATQYLSPHS